MTLDNELARRARRGAPPAGAELLAHLRPGVPRHRRAPADAAGGIEGVTS